MVTCRRRREIGAKRPMEKRIADEGLNDVLIVAEEEVPRSREKAGGDSMTLKEARRRALQKGRRHQFKFLHHGRKNHWCASTFKSSGSDQFQVGRDIASV